MRSFRRAGIVLAIAAVSMAAKCGASPRGDCPLEVRRVWLSGKAPQVLVRNTATHPIRDIVFHVAYQDLFTKYQETEQAIDSVVPPGQKLTIPLQPVSGSIEWETLQVFATCRQDSLPG